MSDELEKYAIETDQVIDPDFDLVELREKGISLIQKYSGTAWTDHNIHDPGITILEQLCLAIADISYQTEHVIDATGNTAFENSPYFDFALARNTNPLITFKDFTDKILEFEGIYKVYYIPSISHPCINGIYDMIVFCDQETNKKDALNHINSLKNSWRPICSKFETVHFPPQKNIEIQLTLEVNEIDNISATFDRYVYVIKEFLKGKNHENNFFKQRIFDVATFSKKISLQLQSADLVAAINQVEITKNIIDISIKDPNQDFVWTLNFDTPYELLLDPNSSITIFNNGNLIGNWVASEAKKKRKKSKPNLDNENLNGSKNSTFEKLTDFYSLQKGMPEIYELEKEIIGKLDASNSSALQLKGILSTYDILISQFISQLEKTFHILNNRQTNLSDLAKEMLTIIPGIQWVWIDFNDKFEGLKPKEKHSRFVAWKNYLQNQKQSLHELVNTSSRTESEAIENRIKTYMFLLQLMGFDLKLIIPYFDQLTNFEKANWLEEILQYWLTNRLYRIHVVGEPLQALTQNSEIGFRGLLSKILNTKFDTFVFSQRIPKIAQWLTRDSGTNIKINTNFPDFMYWGRNHKAYSYNEQNELVLIGNNSETVAKIGAMLNEEELADLTKKIADLHDNSEGFCVIEHSALTPNIDEHVFGVIIYLESNILLKFDATYSISELYEILNFFEKNISNNEFSFEIKKIGAKQFVNILKTEKLYSQIEYYYPSIEQALEGQQNLKQLLKVENLDFQFFDTMFYQFQDQFDPYSFTMSICFPDWHEKYSDTASKDRILNLLDSITPAHVIIKPHWLNPKELSKFLTLYEEYSKLPNFNANANVIRGQLLEILMDSHEINTQN